MAMAKKIPELVLIGQAIRKIRKAKGYSQESFAYETGLGRGYYGGGERNIAALNLVKIAKKLNVQVGGLKRAKNPDHFLKKLRYNSSLSFCQNVLTV
jgi:transcriptional regulator with XRE-family HTH domain